MYDGRTRITFNYETGEILVIHPDHAPRVINIEEMDELGFPGEQEIINGRRVFNNLSRKSPVATARERMMAEYIKRQMKWSN